MKKVALLLFWAFAISAFGEADVFSLDNVQFHVRVPKGNALPERILVLFGGRDWNGKHTLEAFDFNDLADRHCLLLLAPSFKGDDYWLPAKWSGSLLLKAIEMIEAKYKMTARPLLLYGYSAGGQCAAHFASWMPPERVQAWGAHGCGYYPDCLITQPALITCGVEDIGRLWISRQFVYRYRENGGSVVWKIVSAGHELTSYVLKLATVWFDAVISDAKPMLYGEDDVMRLTIPEEIDIEFRNPLPGRELQRLWLNDTVEECPEPSIQPQASPSPEDIP